MSSSRRPIVGLLLMLALCSSRVAVADEALTLEDPDAHLTIVPASLDKKPPARGNLEQALITGTPYWQERYRFEDVDQQNYKTDANAQTLRTILGYRTGSYRDTQVDLGLLNVAQFGGHDFNDGADGRSNFPSIVDPGATQLYSANIKNSSLPETAVIGGRQNINLDNLRWVGAANWRQIPQTFDGVTTENKSLPDIDAFYSHLFHVNRAPGDAESNGTYDLNTDLLHLAYTGLPFVKFVGYSYLVDIGNQVRSMGAVVPLSSATTGLRLEAKYDVDSDWSLSGNGEYARQVPYGNNPDNFGLNYYLLEPGVNYRGLMLLTGREVLGGNGRDAVQSPLMASHPMNGWADQFTIIPTNGLVDSYIGATYRFQLPLRYLDETKVEGRAHTYSADQIGSHYGDEYDLDFVQKVADHYSVGAQYADYRADHLLTNKQKIILTVELDY